MVEEENCPSWRWCYILHAVLNALHTYMLKKKKKKKKKMSMPCQSHLPVFTEDKYRQLKMRSQGIFGN